MSDITRPIYPVDIDFDEASKAWRANKRRNKNRRFEYICGALRSGGKICTKIGCKNVQHQRQKMIVIEE